MKLWLVSRYDDVFAGLRNPKLSSNRTRMYEQALDDNLRERVRPMLDHLSNWIILLDAPDHGRLRRLVNHAFTPRMLENLRPRIEKMAEEMLDEAARGGEMDFLWDFAYPLPATVICEMLGIPVAQRDDYRGWSDGVMNFSTRGGPMLSRHAVKAQENLDRLTDVLNELIAERRREPKNDLLTGLIAAEDEGDRLTHEELLALCVFTFIAGHETTTNLIANGLLALFNHPDEFARLKSDVDATAAPATEELLRYDSSVTRAVRQAKEDVEIRGRTIEAGETIIFVLPSANRDPDQFPEPDRLDITRAPNKHLSFGFGAHFCIGAQLARIEIEASLRQIVHRTPDIRPNYDRLDWRPTMGVRSLTSLPVRC
jgi:hypothetical protein